MNPVAAEQLEEWRALADAATPGPWTTQKPGMDSATGFAGGVIVAAVARGQGIYANPPGGSYPENDRRFIAAARTAVPAQAAVIRRLRDLLRELADAAEADLKMNQNDDGDGIDGYWTMRNQTAIAAARAALPEEPADGT
jgi:hypothetical protein